VGGGKRNEKSKGGCVRTGEKKKIKRWMGGIREKKEREISKSINQKIDVWELGKNGKGGLEINKSKDGWVDGWELGKKRKGKSRNKRREVWGPCGRCRVAALPHPVNRIIQYSSTSIP